MTAPAPSHHHLHLRVEGRVQGVGFRDACVRHARKLGVDGWVRNRHDGSVEVMARGSAAAITELEAWLHRGPSPARVDRVTPLEGALHAAGEAAAAGFEFRDTI
jgi:acylphosphatase